MEVQSAHGLNLSAGEVIGMMVALLKHMHLQNETGLYAIYTTSMGLQRNWMYNGGKKDEDCEEIAQKWAWPSSHRLSLDERRQLP